MKKILVGIGVTAFLLMWVYAFAENVNILQSSATGDVTVSGDVVTLTCDSSAADSSVGGFQTESFGRGYRTITGYARLGKIDSSTVDTVVLRLMTAWDRSLSLALDTVQTDTLDDTGNIFYWLGKCENWTGWDSIADMNEFWWDVDTWDSASDSANHGVEHNYMYEFKIEGK